MGGTGFEKMFVSVSRRSDPFDGESVEGKVRILEDIFFIKIQIGRNSLMAKTRPIFVSVFCIWCHILCFQGLEID